MLLMAGVVAALPPVARPRASPEPPITRSSAHLALAGGPSTPGSAAATAAASAATATLTPSTVRADDGTSVAYEMGVLHVRENRKAAASAIIDIPFARLRATQPTGAPPIVFLPGGPGSSNLDAFSNAPDPSGNAARRLATFRSLTAAADVIVLDQRGFSARGTQLKLPPVVPLPLDRPNSVEATTAAWTAFARAAAAANPGRDLSGYHIAECAADVDDLRSALGYAKISLLGGSFGSQHSFAVMRLYPERVARAVLSSVEPLDHGYDMPSQVFAALQRIAFDADRAPALQPYLPPGGVMAAVRELRDRFARGPVTVQVTDPDTGRPVGVVLGLEDLQAALYPTGEGEEWPAFVLALYHRHYEDWARAELVSRRKSPFSSVINALIDSGTSGSPTRLHQLATDPAVPYLGTWGFAPSEGSKSAWPTPDLGELRTPVRTTTPVVFLNGDWDVSTPIENMLAIAPYFPASRTIVVHRGAHATPKRLTRFQPAVFAALVEFFRTGATTQLPSEIALPLPTFEVPAFPPPAR